jgi:hypothetical protein
MLGRYKSVELDLLAYREINGAGLPDVECHMKRFLSHGSSPVPWSVNPRWVEA